MTDNFKHSSTSLYNSNDRVTKTRAGLVIPKSATTTASVERGQTKKKNNPATEHTHFDSRNTLSNDLVGILYFEFIDENEDKIKVIEKHLLREIEMVRRRRSERKEREEGQGVGRFV